MPDPAAPTKQQLAVLVGTHLTGLEQLRDAHAAALDTARQQLRCQKGADFDAVRRLGAILLARVEAAQALDRALEPSRQRWYALYATLPIEATNRASEITRETSRLSVEILSVQQETTRVHLAQTSPLDRPGATRDCRELAVQPRPNESGRLVAAAIEDQS